jgi:sulfate adenylyltransferase (ADP) / ATP adenylyltransferase
MEGADVLGFYNGGAVAGASQAHKHLQAVRLPLSPHRAIPMEAVIARGGLGELPFRTAFALRGGRSDLDLYRELKGEHRGAYNLLVTHRWMMFVPRSAPSFRAIDVNALAFAGALFVRDADGLRVVEREGPLALLAGVAQPKG